MHKNYLNLFGHVEKYKWVLRSRKTGVKCEYLRFLVYKVYFYFKLIDAQQDTNIKNKPI